MRKTILEISTQLRLGTKVLKFVFESSPKWASFYFTVLIVDGLIPSLQLYVGKLLIDAIVITIKTPVGANINLILFLTAVTFLIEVTSNGVGTLSMHALDVMKDLITRHSIQKVLNKSADLDLSYFENPKFHDQLEKVQREIYSRPMRAMQDTVELTASVIGVASLLVIVTRLAWFAPIVLLIFSIPRLVFRLKFSYWTFSVTDSRSPYSRRISQIINVLLFKDPAKEIKVLNLKNYFLAKYNEINDRFIKENRALSQKQNAYAFFLDVLGGSARYFLILFAVFKAITARATIGDLIMFNSAIQQFQGGLRGVYAYIARFYEHTLFLNRYFEFIALKPTIINSLRPQKININKPLTIEFRAVSFGYEPGKLILKNVSFKIYDGKDFALVGENGAGKTTLIKLLLRLYDTTSGQILINGTDIREIDLKNLRESIGVIFQDFMRYEMTVKENIGFGNVENIRDTKTIVEAAKLSGADKFIKNFKNKYDTMLGRYFEKGEELSGGEWQKIALARAFFKNAPILILDEPTASLDPKSEYEVFRNLISHTTHKSLILISHRFSTVRIADEIIVLHKGEIVEQGSHESLMKKNGRYAKLYNLQAKWYK